MSAKTGLVLGAVLALAAAVPPASAQSAPPSIEQQADEVARTMREALEKAMRMLGGVLDTVPQYEAPEVLPNGDIIIRRIRPAHPPTPPRREPSPPDRAPAGPKLEET